MENKGNHLKRRAFERVPTSLELHSLNINYFGIATDLSENGMFIHSQKINFPFKLTFEVMIPMNEDMIHVPVKVARVTKSKKFYDGIGVELLRPTKNYLNLVRKLRSASRSNKTGPLHPSGYMK